MSTVTQLLETPETLRAWLERARGDYGVGRARDGSGCPLFYFLLEHGVRAHVDWASDDCDGRWHATTWRKRRPPLVEPLPEWACRFADLIDDCEHERITADYALGALGVVCAAMTVEAR